MRFNFALHFVQFLYHFKDRLSFSSCFSVGQILLGSWMSCGIYLDIFIYLYIWVWTLTFLIHPPLWACMASDISEPWHTHFSETLFSHGFYFPFHMEPDPWRSANNLPDYHNASNRANCLSLLLQSLDSRGYLCSWLHLTFLHLLIEGYFFMANAWRLLEFFGDCKEELNPSFSCPGSAG